LWRDLELNRPLRLLLKYHRLRGYPIAVAHVTDMKLHQIARAKRAINA
jgi:hypothetical protein